MNGFIERMDERRRQRSLRDEEAAAAEAKQQQLDAPGQRGPPVLRSDDSGLSNSSDSTAASLRERARKLQQEALVNRDQATCVRGAQQTFRLRVAEMREQEAARLLAMADAAEDESLQGGAQGPMSPMGSDAHMMHSARGPLMSDTASLSNVDTPRGAMHGECQGEARVAELLAAAAERRDKATCVKGGKQRALLAMAERMEGEAHALAAAIRQQQPQQRQQMQQQHSVAGDDFAPGEAASFGQRSGSSEASFNSQQHFRPQQQQQQYQQQHHQQQHHQQTSMSMYGDQGSYHMRGSRGSEAPYGTDGNDNRSLVLQQQRQQQQQLLPETPREEDERRQHEHAVLVGKRRASGACLASQADQALAEEAEKLRQEALLCRDKARCCSGAKQRQLISLAELKERRAADMIARMEEPGLHSEQHADGSTQQPYKQHNHMQQQPDIRRAAGELRGRVNPRGDSGIFDQ